MCKSAEEGGQRCAAHTRGPYETALARMGDRATDPANYKANRLAWEPSTEGVEIYEAIAEHASTPQGHKEVAAKATELTRINGQINQFALFMRRAQNDGQERATTRKQLEADYKKALAQAVRKLNRSSGELTRSPKATPDWNLQAVYPGVADWWDTERNQGILPTEVTPNVNKDIWLTCPQGHTFSGRGNNVVAPIRNGRRTIPICPECEGRRPRQFHATQEELTSLTDALGNDPDAFKALPPALQYAVLTKMGLLRGSEDSMSRQIGMSIVHGDLTLKEVVTANDVTELEGRVRDNLDDEETLASLTDAALTDDTDTSDSDTDTAINQVLASAGVLSLFDADSDLAADIAHANNEALWKGAETAADLDDYVTRLNSQRGRSPQADAAINRFTTELTTVQATPLPDGYQTTRTLPDGTTGTYEPSLAQRRFATLVDERRCVTNWSGTGAGKTLAAALAVQTTGAQETLIVCPLGVVGQWETELATGYPNNTQILTRLPEPGEHLPPPPEGTNRVWIVNYDKFQGDTSDLQARINPLADRVDAVVFDEIHLAKTSDATETSRRRRALEAFRDRAGEANPDLVVIGASATPVVNNLEEAQSILRLVEGPTSQRFPTKPTIKNAAAAHRRLAASGIRHMPTRSTGLTREDDTVDITANLGRVQRRLDDIRKNSNNRSNRVTADMMERALLPEKLPAVTSRALANKAEGNGPTLVYTHYVKGMVNPMRTALENEGLKVATYTGTETEPEKKEALRRFKTGEVDVLIGSSPIATGVDGLQHASNKIIVVSMPWTAAQDEQLVGRLQRHGQTHDVTTTYVLTEAKAGDLTWSWCKNNRQKRIKYKRSMADAAVDGILPEGTLDGIDHGAEKAMDALKNLTAALANEQANVA